jgi:hypothetical protein
MIFCYEEGRISSPNTYRDYNGTYLYRSLHLYSHVPSISVSAMPSLSFLCVNCYWTESPTASHQASICCNVNSYYLSFYDPNDGDLQNHREAISLVLVSVCEGGISVVPCPRLFISGHASDILRPM